MGHLLEYRAGPRAMELLRREGLRPERVRAVAGPASGPRWLALAGIDRALMESGLAAADGSAPRLLVGASAGAWRMLAMASRDPHAAHARLVRGYVHQVFPRGVAPEAVSDGYRSMLADVLRDDDLRHIVSRPSTDVAVHITRLRGPLPWKSRVVQVAAMALGAALHRVSARAISLLSRRMLLHTRPERFVPFFEGTVAPLTPGAILPAALASGTVPVYMAPVRSAGWAPRGIYVDGGLADYHLRQPYVAPGDGITLFPHFQERICAVWFDRGTPGRRPPTEAIADVLQVYPSREFVAGLPGGRLPERDDFLSMVDSPEERIRRWTETAARSEDLGAALLRDLGTGGWAERLRPL